EPARLEDLDPGEDAEHDIDRDGCPCGPCGDRGPVRRLRQSRSHGGRPSRSRRTILPCVGAAERPGSQEHQIAIWCSQPWCLSCSVNDAVIVLPCYTWLYLYGGPFVT